MPIPRQHIRATIDAYLARHPGERAALAPLQQALTSQADPTSRTTFTGHVTCSAVVLDQQHQVLHIHHQALDRYLVPGGHLDEADTSLVTAALRELTEETGLPAEAVTPFRSLSGVPVDVNIHPIPANPVKGEPPHRHFDFRFAFFLPAEHPIRLQPEEVTDYRWLPYDRTASPSVAAKLLTLLSDP